MPILAQATLGYTISILVDSELRKTFEPSTNLLMISLTDDFRALLDHSDEHTPVPTWDQISRSAGGADAGFAGHVARIVSGSCDEQAAVERWTAWPRRFKRSVGLLINKICHEGWLESVGPICGSPYDGGFFFAPCSSPAGTLEDVLDAKAAYDRVYTRSSLLGGLAAYLSAWNHDAWKRSWIENDTPFSSLHIGLLEDGSAEVHLDLFNPVFTNGAPEPDITSLPGLGSYNHRLFRLHRKWEEGEYAPITRTSANYYHFMRGRVPLSF
jgi:hypothetical protein